MLGLLAVVTGAAVAVIFAAAPADAQAQDMPVDLELAFVVDASGSIDEAETRLQRQGYATAITNRHVLGAIERGIFRSIAVAYIEFAAEACEEVRVPWTRITDARSARAFGDRVLALERTFCPGGNAVGDAIAFAAASIDANGFEGTRRIIDISGDGPNTLGRPIALGRAYALARGITINALVIERPEMPDLDRYFQDHVIGGSRAFVVKVERRRAFAAAILKKLIVEVAAVPDGGRVVR